MEKYPEINPHGLTEYHREKLCYPYTSVPAFKFWEPYMDRDDPTRDSMRRWQDGRCGLCGFREVLVVDHCHDTGLIRGLLCRSCNITDGVGNGDGLDQWRAGVTVAAELGIEEIYVDVFGRTPRRVEPAEAELDSISSAMVSSDDAGEAIIAEMIRRSDEQRKRRRLR